MKKWTLKNGLTLIYDQRKTDSAAVQVLVNVGSDWEEARVRGISHYIEHMVFEGTKKRKNAKEIANAIERVGGDTNAYTSNERTAFYAKVPGKHIDIALDVIADMLQDPLLREEDTKRQKHILFKEIDLVTDEPRFHQWVLFEKTLFKKHPSRYPPYGSRKTVTATTTKDIKDFFKKYYHPGNMLMCVVGNVPNIRQKVEKLFTKKKTTKSKRKIITEPRQKKNRTAKEKRKISNTYVVLGHRTVGRTHNDSYILDVIDGILGRGQSGWMFDEIRNKKGLAYEVGTQHVAEKEQGYFATYVSVDKKNSEQVKKVILEQIKKLLTVTPKEVKESQTFIEGDFILGQEDTQKRADEILYWEQMKDATLLDRYIKKINRVTPADVKRITKKYLLQPYTSAIIEGK
jgi:predicted Zn-dependent peptidase